MKPEYKGVSMAVHDEIVRGLSLFLRRPARSAGRAMDVFLCAIFVKDAACVRAMH